MEEAAKETPELRLFDEPDPLTNVILLVEDCELHVHKEVGYMLLQDIFSKRQSMNLFIIVQHSKAAEKNKTATRLSFTVLTPFLLMIDNLINVAGVGELVSGFYGYVLQQFC